MNVPASTKYNYDKRTKCRLERYTFVIYYKLTRISQPLTCVAQFVLGVSISEKAGWYRQHKKIQTFLSELAEQQTVWELDLKKASK